MRILRTAVAVSTVFWLLHIHTAFAQSESQTWAALAKAYGAKKTPLAEADKKAIATIHTLASEWNSVSTPLVRDALDKNVSVEQWLQRAAAPLNKLDSIYTEMEMLIKSFSDDGVRQTIQPSIAAHGELLAAYNQLRNALAAGDAAKEQTALKNLRAGGERKLAAGKPILDQLRKSFGSDQVDQILGREFSKLKAGVSGTTEASGTQRWALVEKSAFLNKERYESTSLAGRKFPQQIHVYNDPLDPKDEFLSGYKQRKDGIYLKTESLTEGNITITIILPAGPRHIYSIETFPIPLNQALPEWIESRVQTTLADLTEFRRAKNL